MYRLFFSKHNFKSNKQFSIVDEDEQVKYFVQSHHKFLKKKFTILKEDHHPLAEVNYKFRGLLYGLEVVADGEVILNVKQKTSFKKKIYETDLTNLKIEGGLLGDHLQIQYQNDTVGSIRKVTNMSQNYYRLLIYDQRFEKMIIPLAVGLTSLDNDQIANLILFT